MSITNFGCLTIGNYRHRQVVVSLNTLHSVYTVQLLSSDAQRTKSTSVVKLSHHANKVTTNSKFISLKTFSLDCTLKPCSHFTGHSTSQTMLGQTHQNVPGKYGTSQPYLADSEETVTVDSPGQLVTHDVPYAYLTSGFGSCLCVCWLYIKGAGQCGMHVPFSTKFRHAYNETIQTTKFNQHDHHC